MQRRLLLDSIARRAAEIRRRPESHPLRRELLKAELLPYQLDGIAFAAGAKTFKSLPEEDRRKLEALLNIRLNEVSRRGESLDTVMPEINDKAKARGLNPEILNSLLDEE